MIDARCSSQDGGVNFKSLDVKRAPVTNSLPACKVTDLTCQPSFFQRFKEFESVRSFVSSSKNRNALVMRCRRSSKSGLRDRVARRDAKRHFRRQKPHDFFIKFETMKCWRYILSKAHPHCWGHMVHCHLAYRPHRIQCCKCKPQTKPAAFFHSATQK